MTKTNYLIVKRQLFLEEDVQLWNLEGTREVEKHQAWGTSLMWCSFSKSITSRKHQKNPNWGAFYKIADQSSLKVLGVLEDGKQGKSYNLSHTGGEQKDKTRKCNMGTKFDLWTEKMMSVKN